MQIRHIKISNFRGIRSLDWSVPGPTVCLLGPGDSAKTSLLTAIEYALWPSVSLAVSDFDFYDLQTDDPITVEVTVGQLPPSLLSEDKFGLQKRGWGQEGSLHDEPEEGDESVLTIRLNVDDSLEAEWLVVNDRIPEGVRIGARDRERLGASGVGAYSDRHLSWGKGSSLQRLTGELDGGKALLVEAYRDARDNLAASAQNAAWTEMRTAVEEPARQLGVVPRSPYAPGFDARGGTGIYGGFALCEGNVPSRMSGTGSRRLLAMAIQRASTQNGAILLIDEIEHGLEPYRLRHLIREVCSLSPENPGQVFMTTHSSVALVECSAENLYVMRVDGGAATVTPVGASLQRLVRGNPEALLGRKVLVGEGKTEVGLARACDVHWNRDGQEPFADLGVVPANGGGRTEAPGVAIDLANLGYDTALVVDSDEPIQPTRAECEAQGVRVIQWEGGVSTEQRVCLDVPLSTLQEILDAALRHPESDAQGELACIASQLGVPRLTTHVVTDWIAAGTPEDAVRLAIGTAGKKRGWFKRIDLGEELGGLALGALHQIPQSKLSRQLAEIKAWLYA